MKKLWSFIKSIPWWAYLAGLVLFGLQFGLYRLAHLIADLSGTSAHSWSPKIPAIDDHIPVVPFFAIFYTLTFIFWITSFIVVFKTSKKNYINFIFAYVLHLLVACVIFTAAPTMMDRVKEGVYDLAKNGKDFLSKLLFFVYESDGETIGTNLFPSLHCSISLFCFLAIYRDEKFSLVFKIISFVSVILICLSTVFTKQHYFLDTIGGISLTIICYLIIKFINPAKWFNLKE